MMPNLPVCTLPQYKHKCDEGECQDLFQSIECIELTFVDADQAWNMCCNVMLLKSGIQTLSVLEEIITTSSEVLNELENNIVVETCMLHKSLGDWQQYCHA
jgi:hypothetical protein